MIEERRMIRHDRRASRRGGRRSGEPAPAWYRKRRVLLAVASLVFVGWRRIAVRARA